MNQIIAPKSINFNELVKNSNIDINLISAIGITNQRETVILWERSTGKPVYNAIVWQCRRTSDICKQLEKDNFKDLIREKTGLLIDPYFSSTKIKWVLDNPIEYKELQDIQPKNGGPQ